MPEQSVVFVVFGAACISLFVFGHRIYRAPLVTMLAGLATAVFFGAADAPGLPLDAAALLASAGVGVLGFTSAAQIRVSRLAKTCPASYRLTLLAAPAFLAACGLTAFIMLPSMTAGSAFLLAAALMLNGAGFDRESVAAAPTPRRVKRAVRYESAAVVALGVPIAVFLTACATTPAPDEPALAPLMSASIGLFAGFGLGGVVGLTAAQGGALLAKALGRDGVEMISAPLAAIVAFAAAPVIAGDPIVAATASGLLWGEQTKGRSAARAELRRVAERLIGPAAYFGFGCLLLPRLAQADLLALVFAAASVTLLRAAPRKSVLQRTGLPKEAQDFLSWYGGAPGAASALFLMTLANQPAIANIDGILTVGALSVVAGVIVARATAKPLVKGLVRKTAHARRRSAI